MILLIQQWHTGSKLLSGTKAAPARSCASGMAAETNGTVRLRKAGSNET